MAVYNPEHLLLKIVPFKLLSVLSGTIVNSEGTSVVLKMQRQKSTQQYT
jgi:hypothetical protein